MGEAQSSIPVALVTGGSSGIGRACADALGRAGFRVFATSRHLGSLGNCNFEPLELDVGSDSSVTGCLSHVLKRTGRLDVLVNNAAVTIDHAAVEEVSNPQAWQLFQTNLFGVLRMVKSALPQMRAQRNGRIINIGSLAGCVPMPFQAIYCASKHALRGLSASLDHEVRCLGVRVCVVEPGFVCTDIAAHALSAGEKLPIYGGDRERVRTAHMAGMAKGMHPSSVAHVVVKAATARAPHLYYTAGFQAGWSETAMRLLPSMVVDWSIRRVLHLS